MKKKFDKYWGNIQEVNQVLIVAVVLDPHGVKDLLMRMYEAYKKEEPVAVQSTGEANVESGGERENSPRFPVLSKIARDVFAVPVSSVPSEVAFSMGKRVVDPFRASLTPKTVEALVCTKDWLSQVAFDFNKQPSEDELEFYQALEKMELGTAILKLCNRMKMKKWPLATNAYCQKLKEA
ncbi:unnamed protein product [Prunus armeniaca]